MATIGKDLFVYRFRILDAGPLPNDWIAGISGRVTYSDLQPYYTACAEEHAARMLTKLPEGAIGQRH
jgi:hypothetical protein